MLMQAQTSPSGTMAQSAGPVLSLNAITKTFPGVRALSEVSLRLIPGKVTALVGENGAGKSTVVKILTGIYQPDSGSILVEGQPTSFPVPQSASDSGVTAPGVSIRMTLHVRPSCWIACSAICTGNRPCCNRDCYRPIGCTPTLAFDASFTTTPSGTIGSYIYMLST